MPDENSSFGTDRDERLLIGSDGNLANVTGVSDTIVIINTFIVVPDLKSLVLATRDEPLSRLGDGKGIDLTSLRAIEHSNGLTIEAVPVGNLSVATSGQNLRLIGMVQNLLEHGGLEEAHDSGAGNDIPNDGGTIER